MTFIMKNIVPIKVAATNIPETFTNKIKKARESTQCSLQLFSQLRTQHIVQDCVHFNKHRSTTWSKVTSLRQTLHNTAQGVQLFSQLRTQHIVQDCYRHRSTTQFKVTSLRQTLHVS
ncbi:LOW QUALITY PROTEIN: hypothetical protein ElyMa_005552000 [Elysia marginata]|uniref:Uncharacterized protein n=1 Tax=Elysia marginata TaxID=1093978 RepID=A0AAV4EYG2_9GAST|nr:LOW QUALITY PROTEIN: hypothetical protein ElyMa_005552000 [Elysia marginata]